MIVKNSIFLKYISLGLTMCLLFSFNQTANAQSFLSTNGQAIVNEQGDTIILRGMGLGGWMLQEGYMLQTAGFATAQYQIREKIENLIGTTDTDLFYEAWLNNHVRKIDIDSLKAWGFNSVRLPMHYNLYTLPIEEEPIAGEMTWLEKGFDLTDSLISWCAANEMYVILDLHGAPGGQGYDQAISDYDPTKPSLWESQLNKNKMASLWKRLAERYVDEPWVAGYDLLNEPNWDLPGGLAMRSLYEAVTDSIRLVDSEHIIFIEGNWFANDFTGLTPPWDDNIVYSPHKYWSHNDQGSIQWVLDLRETHNVPLYLGESGENSNVWFRDAIKLLEDNGIGWAWWPMKKIEAIAGPLSVIKTAAYQTLLDYWNNPVGTPPNSFFAKAALMDMTENLKLENCRYQKDVIDAMFRQVQNANDPKPYAHHTIPGVIQATDFDMGGNRVGYSDNGLDATYQVSTGSFSAWNTGWAYRNDAVDIEVCGDTYNANGFNVGWIEEGEWLQYDVDVIESAVYEIQLRMASGGFDGRFHFSADGSDITNLRYVPFTGGYQTWQTVTVPNVVLTPEDDKLRFFSDGSDYNFSSFELVQTGQSTDIATEFLSAIAVDEYTIKLHLNKPLEGTLPSLPADFLVYVSGLEIGITNIEFSEESTRTLTFTVDQAFEPNDLIRMSYTGDQIEAVDGTVLNTFNFEEVQNAVPLVHDVPGRVEAEGFFNQSGVELENTFDTGGGKNVGHLDGGDYLDYYLDVAQAGTYQVDFRTAAESEVGAFQVQRISEQGTITILNTTSFISTGDWQNWATTTSNIYLNQGKQHIRLVVTQSNFNFNWFEFSFLTAIDEPTVEDGLSVSIFPNPNNGHFMLRGTFNQPQALDLAIYNLMGQVVHQESISQEATSNGNWQKHLDLSQQANGTYWVAIRLGNGKMWRRQVVKL